MGRIRRLIITMPPRHGKSQLCSRFFPAWFLGMWPDKRIILTGYGTEFATEWGRESRNVLDMLGTITFVDISVRGDSYAAHRWGLAGHEGGLIAAGIGGGITGRGADILVIDDPIKSMEEAESEKERRRVWMWWQSTSGTRLTADGAVVLIMTRWHENDLAGMMLATNDDPETPPDERWTLVHLPAIAEPPPKTKVDPETWRDPIGRKVGQALWPQHYSRKNLLAIKHRVGPIVWNGLYQGRPSAPEGSMFKVENWRYAKGVPHGSRFRLRFDLASTEKTATNDPDYTAGVLMARDDETGRTFVVEVRRFQGSDLQTEKFVRDFAEWCWRAVRQGGVQELPIRIEQEPGGSGKALAQHYVRKVLQGFAAEKRPSERDKTARARPFSAQQEAGNVYLVEAAWNDDFVEEHRVFPNDGTHDDQVDAASLAYSDLVEGFDITTGTYRKASKGR